MMFYFRTGDTELGLKPLTVGTDATCVTDKLESVTEFTETVTVYVVVLIVEKASLSQTICVDVTLVTLQPVPSKKVILIRLLSVPKF